MGAKTGQLHGRDHGPNGRDPVPGFPFYPDWIVLLAGDSPTYANTQSIPSDMDTAVEFDTAWATNWSLFGNDLLTDWDMDISAPIDKVYINEPGVYMCRARGYWEPDLTTPAFMWIAGTPQTFGDEDMWDSPVTLGTYVSASEAGQPALNLGSGVGSVDGGEQASFLMAITQDLGVPSVQLMARNEDSSAHDFTVISLIIMRIGLVRPERINTDNLPLSTATTPPTDYQPWP